MYARRPESVQKIINGDYTHCWHLFSMKLDIDSYPNFSKYLLVVDAISNLYNIIKEIDFR